MCSTSSDSTPKPSVRYTTFQFQEQRASLLRSWCRYPMLPPSRRSNFHYQYCTLPHLRRGEFSFLCTKAGVSYSCHHSSSRPIWSSVESNRKWRWIGLHRRGNLPPDNARGRIQHFPTCQGWAAFAGRKPFWRFTHVGGVLGIFRWKIPCYEYARRQHVWCGCRSLHDSKVCDLDHLFCHLVCILCLYYIIYMQCSCLHPSC